MSRPKGPDLKPLGVRLLPAAIDALQFGQRYSTPTSAAAAVLNLWSDVISDSLGEIRGRLSFDEVQLILDVSNGLLLEPSMIGQHIEIQVRDAIRFEDAAKRWKLDGDKLVATLASLTRAQRIALELWAADAWEHSEDHAYWEAAIARLVPEDAA